MLRIAIDAMGGDYSPKEPIDGIKSYLDEFSNQDILFYIVGNQDIISNEMQKKGIKDYSESNIRKDYILGLFVPFQKLIVASTALNNGSQRGEQLISLVIKRMQSIIDDHNLLSQLSRI